MKKGTEGFNSQAAQRQRKAEPARAKPTAKQKARRARKPSCRDVMTFTGQVSGSSAWMKGGAGENVARIMRRLGISPTVSDGLASDERQATRRGQARGTTKRKVRCRRVNIKQHEGAELSSLIPFLNRGAHAAAPPSKSAYTSLLEMISWGCLVTPPFAPLGYSWKDIHSYELLAKNSSSDRQLSRSSCPDLLRLFRQQKAHCVALTRARLRISLVAVSDQIKCRCTLRRTYTHVDILSVNICASSLRWLLRSRRLTCVW